MYIIASAQLVFAGSADTTLFLIDESGGPLLAMSGFLNSTTDPIENFRGEEALLYTDNADRVREVNIGRVSSDKTSEHHSTRKFEMTDFTIKMFIKAAFSPDLQVL